MNLSVGQKYSSSTRSAGLCIILLLFLSGNIHPNPGPELIELLSPDDLKDSSGLRFIHVNVRSLINKIDAIHLWAKLTESDLIVLSRDMTQTFNHKQYD